MAMVDSRSAEMASTFVHDALDSPIISLILNQTIQDNLDTAKGEDAVTTFLQERGYDTSLEVVTDAAQQVRDSDVSVWRGLYTLYVDGQPGSRLLIGADGTVSVNGVTIQKPTYVASVLSWSTDDGNASSARLQFDIVVGSRRAYSGSTCSGEYTTTPDGGGTPTTSSVFGKLNTFSPAGAAPAATDPLEFWNGSYVVTIDRSGTIERHQLAVDARGNQGTVQVDGQTVAGWHFGANLLRWDATSGNAFGGAVLFTEHPATGLHLCVGRIWRQADPEAAVANATGMRLPDELVGRSLRESTGTIADWQAVYHVTVNVAGPTQTPVYKYALLEIRSDGTLTFDGNAPVTPTYDPVTPSVSWSVSQGNATAGTVIMGTSNAVPNLRVFRGRVWGTVAGEVIDQSQTGPSNAQGTEVLKTDPPIASPDEDAGPVTWLIAGSIGLVAGALGVLALWGALALRRYYASQNDGNAQGALQAHQNVQDGAVAVEMTARPASASQSIDTSSSGVRYTEQEYRDFQRRLANWFDTGSRQTAEARNRKDQLQRMRTQSQRRLADLNSRLSTASESERPALQQQIDDEEVIYYNIGDALEQEEVSEYNNISDLNLAQKADADSNKRQEQGERILKFAER